MAAIWLVWSTMWASLLGGIDGPPRRRGGEPRAACHELCPEPGRRAARSPGGPAVVAPNSTPRDAHLPGVRLRYVDTGGEGPAVVLMHAATGHCGVWEHQLPALTGVGLRVIAHDRRGWGCSVVDPSGPQPGTAADDLRALADHLGLER